MEIYSIKYTIPYFLAFGFLIVLMFYEFSLRNRSKSITHIKWLVALGFLFFFGLRGFIDTDFINYYPMFNGLNPIFEINFNEYFQRFSSAHLFWLSSSFLKSFFSNYFVWIFINTLIDILLLDKLVSRYSKYYVLPFLFFFIFQGVVLELNLFRNLKAILLFLLSIKYIEERKFFPFLFLNLAGMMIHDSSIIYLPMYFLLHKRFSVACIWVVFSVGIVIYIFQIEFIEPIAMYIGYLLGGQFEVYVNLYVMQRVLNTSFIGFSFGLLEKIFTFLLVMYFFRKNAIDEKHRVFFNAYIVYLVLFLFLSEIYVIADRFATLFVFSYWFLYPAIFSFLKNIKYKYIFVILLILYGGAKTSLLNSVFSRYENILFGISSFEERRDIVHKYFNSR